MKLSHPASSSLAPPDSNELLSLSQGPSVIRREVSAHLEALREWFPKIMAAPVFRRPSFLQDLTVIAPVKSCLCAYFCCRIILMLLKGCYV